MDWRDWALRHLGPGMLGGLRLTEWVRLLRENRFDVDARYWHRAALVTAGTVMTSAASWLERLRYRKRIAETAIAPPLFVLGIWRSGTSHLHNLLSIDSRFGYATLYDVLNPHTFLSAHRLGSRIMAAGMPATRPQDGMRQTAVTPAEEEFAVCLQTLMSFLLGLVFPRRANYYNRYLTLTDLTQQELDAWKEAFTWFLRKLTLRYGRPVVLKSPGNTCRIRLLLELFPDAKFVHIHRHPYAVLQSSEHSVKKLSPYLRLQSIVAADLPQRMIDLYAMVYERFFAERALIPAGRLHEVRFEELEQDPLGQLREVYLRLNLPDFSAVEPKLESYCAQLSGYRKNEFPPLPPELRRQLRARAPLCFSEWGYGD